MDQSPHVLFICAGIIDVYQVRARFLSMQAHVQCLRAQLSFPFFCADCTLHELICRDGSSDQIAVGS